MINKATNATLPTVAPAMTPALEVLLVDAKVLWLDVGVDATVAVDDGAPATRHEASVESATNSKSDTPPCLPCESTIKNKRLVPSVTSAIQL